MNWRKATDQELITIITSDSMARLTDVLEAKEELDRRSRQTPKQRLQNKKKVVYPK